MDHGGIKSLLERVPEHFQQLSIDWERIRKLSPEAGCKVLARYWVVERTCSWIDQNRRLREDCEKLTESSEAFIYLAMSRLSCRRRASGGRGRSWSGALALSLLLLETPSDLSTISKATGIEASPSSKLASVKVLRKVSKLPQSLAQRLVDLEGTTCSFAPLEVCVDIVAITFPNPSKLLAQRCRLAESRHPFHAVRQRSRISHRN